MRRWFQSPRPTRRCSLGSDCWPSRDDSSDEPRCEHSGQGRCRRIAPVSRRRVAPGSNQLHAGKQVQTSMRFDRRTATNSGAETICGNPLEWKRAPSRGRAGGIQSSDARCRRLESSGSGNELDGQSCVRHNVCYRPKSVSRQGSIKFEVKNAHCADKGECDQITRQNAANAAR